MKRVYLIFLLIFIIFIYGCYQATEVEELPELKEKFPQVEGGFSKYYSDKKGIAFIYPDDWELKDGPAINLISPSEGDSDIYQEKVIINRIGNFDRDITLEKYKDLELQQRRNSNDNIIELTKTIFADRPAYKIVFESRGAVFSGDYNKPADSFKKYNIEIFTLKDNIVYHFYFGTEYEKYPEYLDKVNKIINSLEID